MNLLFYLFFIGIFIASLQDLKRREVDNWLNFFLLVSGFGFVVFSAVFDWNFKIILMGLFSFAVMFTLANLFYYGRVFAGGDAKLLIAMCVLFAGASLKQTLANIGVFVVFLMLAGSLWGLCYILFLFVRDFGKIERYLKKEIKKDSKFLILVLIACVVLSGLSFSNILFLFLLGFVLASFVLFMISKGVEKVSMVNNLDVKDLREGDWLVEDVKVGKKIIKKDWEGLTKEDLFLLRGRRKKVLIKQGIPFVPGFLFGFLGWWFYRDVFLRFLVGFVG